MLKNFIDHIEQKLQSQLPGIDAQKRMMPIEGATERFNLDKKDVNHGGVLILFYLKNNRIHIPLTQRHNYKGTHGGQVSLPGGKLEDQDNTIIDTALRETHEEIGIHKNHINVIGQLTELYIPPSNFHVTPVLGYIDTEPKFILDSFEVKELIETPLHHLFDHRQLKEKEILVRNEYKLKAPYFDVREKVVWGATAMILSELKELLADLKDSY